LVYGRRGKGEFLRVLGWGFLLGVFGRVVGEEVGGLMEEFLSFDFLN